MTVLVFIFFMPLLYSFYDHDYIYISVEINRLKGSFHKLTLEETGKSFEEVFSNLPSNGVRRAFYEYDPEVETSELAVVRDFLVRAEPWSTNNVEAGSSHVFLNKLDPTKVEEIKVS